MDKIRQDFKFTSLYSAPYGKWLATIYEAVPDVAVTAVNDWYPYTANATHVSVTVPEDIAMLLKLQFGGHLVERPAIHPAELQKENDQYKYKMKFLKERHIKEEDNKNYVWHDYESNNSLKEGIILKDYYDKLKKVSVDYYKKKDLYK
jgi:hypothetical protein